MIEDRVPRWRWAVGDIIVDRQLAMHRDRPAVAVVHRVVRARGTVGVEVAALYTWRDGHGERYGNGPPRMERVDSGFRFEEAYRVSGPGFRPSGVWYRGARYRREAERGLGDREDLWFAGTFQASLAPGEEVGVTAWADDSAQPPPPPRRSSPRLRPGPRMAGRPLPTGRRHRPAPGGGRRPAADRRP